MKRVLVFDTSVLCCLLQIPGKETAGPENDRWDFQRIDALVKAERERAVFVLPLASIIETGNHVAQAPSRRYEIASALGAMIGAAADAASPWAPFTDQADLWGAGRLRSLAASWPELAAAGITIGDATIKDVAEHYAAAGFAVEIVTGDGGLKAYEPVRPVPTPRRRSGAGAAPAS
jgi:hypothetical protein